MTPSVAGLRVLRSIVERGTFTAAAADLGFTQSAVSRQLAALERETGHRLLVRGTPRARPTPAGLVVLAEARVVLDALDRAERALRGDGTASPGTQHVRLGVYVSAGARLLPAALTTLRETHPEIEVTTREGTTPALVRAVRAGTLDLALVTSRPPYRPPDGESPPLQVTTVSEGGLLVAAPDSGAYAGASAVALSELAGATWIASPSVPGEPLLGVWPGLPGRPRVAHQARDWLTKLSLVAAGCGVTTVPADLTAEVPAGVVLLRVEGSEPERRRTVLVRLPGEVPVAVEHVGWAVQDAAL